MKKYYYTNEIYHHGIKGQKWGQRRYQNPDGSLTEAGKKRYYMTKDEYDKKIASYTKKMKIANVISGVSGGLAGADIARGFKNVKTKKDLDDAYNVSVNNLKQQSADNAHLVSAYNKDIEQKLKDLEKSKDRVSSEYYNETKNALIAQKDRIRSEHNNSIIAIDNNYATLDKEYKEFSENFTKAQRGIKIAVISTTAVSAGAAIVAERYRAKIKDLEANWVEKKE